MTQPASPSPPLRSPWVFVRHSLTAQITAAGAETATIPHHSSTSLPLHRWLIFYLLRVENEVSSGYGRAEISCATLAGWMSRLVRSMVVFSLVIRRTEYMTMVVSFVFPELITNDQRRIHDGFCGMVGAFRMAGRDLNLQQHNHFIPDDYLSPSQRVVK
ncbi:hypothetical protein CBL_00521 [Carabus blaptoides fortunei]